MEASPLQSITIADRASVISENSYRNTALHAQNGAVFHPDNPISSIGKGGSIIVIYADILILVNIYIDYFLLLGVKRFLHLPTRTFRLAAGSILGGLCGLLSLLRTPFYATFLLLFLSAGLVCFTVFWNKNFVQYIKSTACFLAFSLIFSGIVILFIQLFGIHAAVVGGRVYFDISPFLLFLFTVIAYLISMLLERIRGRKEPDSIYRRILIEDSENQVELFCKVDTGNDLREPFSGLPVLVATHDSVSKILPHAITDYLNHIPTETSLRLIPYHSLAGSGLLPAFRPKRILDKKSQKPLNCYLAIYDGVLSASGYDALINPELLESI